MKKNIITTTTLATVAFLGLSGCGSSDTATSGTIAITALCNASGDTSAYHALQSGDTIEKSSNTLLPDGTAATPEYKIVMLSDGSKKVCKVTGDAAIVRP